MSTAARPTSVRSTKSTATALLARSTLILAFIIGCTLSGCSTPQVPSMTGAGAFHDVTQIRKGMSPNEVRNVMGAGYKNVMEEGIRGMDGGNYTWVYPEGKIYFGYDGVTSVEPLN